jgi:hypothetical protein
MWGDVEIKCDFNGGNVFSETSVHRFVAVEVQKKVKLKQGKGKNKETSRKLSGIPRSNPDEPFQERQSRLIRKSGGSSCFDMVRILSYFGFESDLMIHDKVFDDQVRDHSVVILESRCFDGCDSISRITFGWQS